MGNHLFVGVSVSTGSSHLGSKTLAAIVVPCILVVGVLFGLLAMFVVRHVRLQNRLRSFADSHYDTRLGTATFTSGDDLGAYRLKLSFERYLILESVHNNQLDYTFMMPHLILSNVLFNFDETSDKMLNELQMSAVKYR